MKIKNIFLYFFCFILFPPVLSANQYQPFKEEQIFSKNLNYSHNVNIPLPSGNWIVKVVDTSKSTGKDGTIIYNVGLFQLDKNKRLNQYLQITFSEAISTFWPAPPECSRENVYAYETSLGKGNFNCWMVNHFNLSSSLSRDKLTIYEQKLKDVLNSENIKFSDIMIYSQHSFSSSRSGNVYHLIKHFINPEAYGMEPPANVNWNTSEYQKIKISSYPKKKEFLDSFVSASANFHMQFQDGIGVNKIDKIVLDKYINSNISNLNISTK